MRALRLMAILVAGACADSTGPRDQANERIAIVNNPAVLAARVTYLDDTIAIDSTSIGYPTPAPSPVAAGIAPSPKAAQAPFVLRLRAEVAPPVVGGQTLQATSVAIVGELAVVSYSMVGNPYLGAIDVIDITNKNNPILRSSASFLNTDVFAVAIAGSSVYVAAATDDTAFAAPALFEVMQLQGYSLVLSGNQRMELSSFVATSVAASGTRAYATSGDNGGLFVIDAATFTAIDTMLLDDARWVAVGGGKIVVLQGTPGRLAVFDEATLAPAGPFSFPGADVPESKSTVEIAGGKAFIAAGTGGVQVLSATTGNILGSVPRPSPDSLGLDSAVVVTNAVAVDQDRLFISNGEAGVYAVQGSQVFSASGSEVLPTLTMLGRLQFGSLQSVNHVAMRSNNLIVAAGLGGLKIVQVQ
jgi:hypothetical protein